MRLVHGLDFGLDFEACSQVKQRATITYKHDIYELPHELPQDLRLRKSENISKVSKLYKIIA